MRKRSILEKVAASLPIKISAGLIASVGNPLAGLLPTLTDTLAGRRHSQRIEQRLHHIELKLKAQRHRVNTLTDPQYKLLNEVVLTILQTTEEEKIEFLQLAIEEGISASEINHTQASQVARALRDMTAGEIQFLVQNIGSDLMIGPLSGDLEEDVVVIDTDSLELSYLTGLLALGAVIPRGSSMDDIGRYSFAPFCKNLCELVAPSNQELSQ